MCVFSVDGKNREGRGRGVGVGGWGLTATVERGTKRGPNRDGTDEVAASDWVSQSPHLHRRHGARWSF